MLSVVDIVVLVVLLVGFLLIGYFFREKNSTNVMDYFLARRKMSAIPAACSICVSFMSSVGFTIYIGEIYSFGIPQYAQVLAVIIVAPIVTQYFQPLFYDSPHVSVYQHLEERFSKLIRYFYSIIFLCTSFFNLGVVGYAASITGEVLADVPFWVSALCVGLLSTLYSTLGGLKAVIWTDVCQALIMLFFFVAIIVKILVFFGGFSEPWHIINSGERIQFSFKEGPEHRYSVTSVFIVQFIFVLHMMCVSQPAVQRWRSVGSLAEAKKTAIATLIILIILTLTVSTTALLLYAFYSRCSVNGSAVPRAQIMSLTFVSKELSSWPGMKGLCFGSILSAALSTYSSFINSMAAVTLEDFVKIKLKTLTATRELLLSKILTAVYGDLCTGLMFVVARSKTVMMVYSVSQSVAVAPPLGAFILAMWSRRANTLGVSIGTVISVTVVLSLSICALTKGNRHVPLPSINPMCLDNYTIANITTKADVSTDPESSVLQFLSDISFNWYFFIGTVSVIIFAYAFSLCNWVPQKLSGKNRQDTELNEVHPNSHLPNSAAIEKLLVET